MRRFGAEQRLQAGTEEGGGAGERRFKGVRRRRWGKWVSEVRVPGTRERLWLGSYATPEAAAVAYDTAVFHLKGPSSAGGLNFPGRLPPGRAWAGLSPRSVQRVASDAGMAVDAELVPRSPPGAGQTPPPAPLPEDAGTVHGTTRWDGEQGAATAAAAAYRVYGRDQGRVGPTLDISVEDMDIYL